MKDVYAWLRTVAVAGEFPGPTSEDAYLANLGTINTVHPDNGGKLQADGTWLQESGKIAHPWPQSIPGIAQTNGHLYMPMVECDRSAILDGLDNPAVQEAAASNLVALAESGRFDSPWDGVCLDLEGIPSAYKDKLSDFLYLISYKVRAAGFPLAIWVRGKVSDPGPDYDQRLRCHQG